MKEAVLDFVYSLDLEEKLSPRKNVEIIWFYVFFPFFIAYIWILTTYINLKPSIGSIEILDSEFSRLLYPKYNMEVIATGMSWAEGPLWINDENAGIGYLMFSDPITNLIYKWEDGKGMFTVGKTIYSENGGCNQDKQFCDSFFMPGANGLMRKDSASLDLIVCQHGERAISLFRENGTQSAIATHFKGKRLNSPNDVVFSPDGHLYFTDPPFGLYNKNRSALIGKEIPFSGIYFIARDFLQNAISTGNATEGIILLDKSMSRPNGLAFSPDYSKLYVSNCDFKDPIIKVFDVSSNGALLNSKVFFNASELYQNESLIASSESEDCQATNSDSNETSMSCARRKVGCPDGLKVDIHGNVFATGPGGVLVFNQVHLNIS